MKLDPTDLAYLAALAIFTIVLATRDDPRWFHAVKSFWREHVGAWFARRRSRIRVPDPDEHSRGIMVARRDVNVGWWT